MQVLRRLRFQTPVAEEKFQMHVPGQALLTVAQL